MNMKIFMILFVIILSTLSGCGTSGDTADSPIGSNDSNNETGSEKVSVDNCPEPGEGTYILLYAGQGYCFLYPDNYDVFQSENGSITLYQKSLLNTEAPVATVERQPTNGETLGDITAQRLVNFSLPESAIQDTTLGGQPAILLDNLPGQDLNRRVISVHGDYVYDLIVARIGPEYGQVGDEAEVLFDQINNSFQFIGVEPEAPLLAGPECPEPIENTTIYRNEPGGYCFLIPSEYLIDDSVTSESNGLQTVFYINSLQDVEHPKLFVTVEDAGGRSLEEITAAHETEIESAVPNYDVTWSFGYMLDGIMANQFDQVPGQDFSRQLLFIRDGQLYTLTFVPDDPQAGQAFAEMETLYNTVVDSFSFLWTS